MTETAEETVIKLFRESLAQERLPSDISVTYRVEGGMPSERVEESVVLKGNRQVTARSRNMLATGIPREASDELPEQEARELLEQVSNEVEGLIVRKAARFPPDSVVGTITIDVKGRQATFFFPAEEPEGPEAAEASPMRAMRSLRHFRELSKRLVGSGGGGQ